MTQRSATPSLATIERAARRAESRLRLSRALAWGSKALSVALVVALAVLVLRKTGHLSELVARVGLAIDAALVMTVMVAAFTRRLPGRAGAVALDRFHGLSDRLSSALSFAALPEARRTPFMTAAIEDAVSHGERIDPRAAVPLRAPREWPIASLLAVALALVGAFEVRKHAVSYGAKTIDAVDVAEDDLDAMREFLRDLDQRLTTDEAKAATQEFNQLIEDLAEKRLDRSEAFSRMAALENKLLEGREADAKALEEVLKKMGAELKKSELTKPAGEALENTNLAQAEKAMQELAKKLRSGGGDKAQLEKMRDALKKAGEGQKERAATLSKRRGELQEQLLKQRAKQGDAGASEQDKSLLQKRERELERLDRESEQQRKNERELDRLDRELQKAAEDLMRDPNMSADDLDRAAEDLNRMARQDMTQEEKEQLRKKLEELRETLRQQQQGGGGQMQRMRMFQQRARGQQGGKGAQSGGSGEEQGKDGDGSQGGGQGGDKGQGEGWVLGPSGEKMLMVTASLRRSGQGSGTSGKGEGAGTGHDPKVQGGATSLKGGTEDTQVAGNDTGQGSSRSEVIVGAAERGFASRGYQRVFREYHTVAEEALDRDEIPGGYRFYVRRYFQLIRPREEGSAAPSGASAPSGAAPDSKVP